MISASHTARSLEKSIAHWRENEQVTLPREVHLGPTECALCTTFYSNYCSGCPVKERTGHTGCHGSPYNEADKAHEEWALAANASRRKANHKVHPFLRRWRAAEAFRLAARDERLFLESLRWYRVEEEGAEDVTVTMNLRTASVLANLLMYVGADDWLYVEDVARQLHREKVLPMSGALTRLDMQKPR
jgi:hypothetical protein